MCSGEEITQKNFIILVLQSQKGLSKEKQTDVHSKTLKEIHAFIS